MNEFKVIDSQQTPRIEPVLGMPILDVECLEDFLKFASSRWDAVGLAANQCSVNGERYMERVFAIKNGKWDLVINPEIVEYVGIKEVKKEGCLTWGVYKSVIAERSLAIVVNYYDLKGNFHRNVSIKGFQAQVWQHEVNHLNGVEEKIVDRSAPFEEAKECGRNEPCPCGSGEKYKNCCLKLRG